MNFNAIKYRIKSQYIIYISQFLSINCSFKRSREASCCNPYVPICLVRIKVIQNGCVLFKTCISWWTIFGCNADLYINIDVRIMNHSMLKSLAHEFTRLVLVQFNAVICCNNCGAILVFNNACW